MMIVFHFLWNLNFFYNYNINLYSGFWKIFQIITASLFLFLVGISIFISNVLTKSRFSKYFFRGLKIFLLGLIITIVTKIIFPQSFIVFGVLHLIGLSIIMLYFFKDFFYLNLIFGICFIIFGKILPKVNFNYLLFLGLHSETFHSIDYFPIFPWFGIFLFGLFFGRILFSIDGRNYQIKDLSNYKIVKIFCFIGKHSLKIYLYHQVIFYILFKLSLL